MENKERDFKGVWIPKDIWLNKDLSIIEKCLLVEIDSLDNDPEKGCFKSNESLGEFFNMKEGSMANMISDLKARGYISQVFFDGRNRGLRVNKEVKPPIKNESRVHKKVKAALTKKGKQDSQKNERSINMYSNTNSNTEKEEKQPSAIFDSMVREEIAPVTLTLESLKAELLKKAGLPNSLNEYMQKVGVPPTHEKAGAVFNHLFEGWLGKRMAEVAALPITQGDEQACINQLSKHYERKVSIKSELLNLFYYKTDVAQKFLKQEQPKQSGRKQEFLNGHSATTPRPKFIKRQFTQTWVEVAHYIDGLPHDNRLGVIEADTAHLTRFCTEYIDYPQ